MKTATVSLSDILKHPTGRIDAAYWVGKTNKEKAYVKQKAGLLEEDDTNGKIMLSEADANLYNESKKKINEITDSISEISEKVNK